MSVEFKLFLVFVAAGLIFAYMQYLHKKKCEAADRQFERVMKGLADKAKREKENEKAD